MKILDAGHAYELDSLDGGSPIDLWFVKREGENFPFNSGNRPGTNCQEVLRALIDRCRYLNNQKPCAETEAIIGCLETALLLFELRAARRHGRTLCLQQLQELMCARVCKKCLHVGCTGGCRMEEKQCK